MQIRIPHRFKIRDYQLPVASTFDQGLIKRFIDVWHRRAGKDTLWLNLTIKGMLKRVGCYYHVFPTYRQGKKILWEGINAEGMKFMDHFPPELIDGTNNTDLQIQLKNGSLWQIIGSDTCDGDAIVGTNPAGLVFSEYSIQNPTVWDKVRPILVENGGWAAFCYTPRGHNHGYELYQTALKNPALWHASMLTIDQTLRGLNEPRLPGLPVVTREQYLQEIADGMEEDMALQEFYCSFEGSKQGSYYGEWLAKIKQAGQITKVPWDPRLPVFTFWDLGVDDQTTIWFMQHLRDAEYRFIDCYSKNGKGLDHYVKVVNERPYVYDTHYLPHDIDVREIGAPGARSRLETMVSLGIPKKSLHAGECLPVLDGIGAVRTLLPLCWFDEVKCKDGISALQNYMKEWDDRRKKFKDSPEHDWSSHYADAFREFAVNFKSKVAVKPRTPSRRERPTSRGGWMGG